ncbi:DUF6233 domain-containing protein [Streptomyces sp. NPDC090077]|uniref:DUF6233 domain-containing protein n=1 Tax=Streptomyces sp. NPDC090077 TaxID=3365938 RepID=UPI00381A5652
MPSAGQHPTRPRERPQGHHRRWCRPPDIHVGGCWGTRTRCKPASADAARRAPAEVIPACPHCRPDTAPGALE